MIRLTGNDLAVGDVEAVARDGAEIDLSDTARAAVVDSANYLNDLVAEGHPIYGLTTGVGALDGRPVAASNNRDQQRNLLRSHAAGTGDAMSRDAVRAMMTGTVPVSAFADMANLAEAMGCAGRHSLDLVVLGCSQFGIPGAQPDSDLDGDGLERLYDNCPATGEVDAGAAAPDAAAEPSAKTSPKPSANTSSNPAAPTHTNSQTGPSSETEAGSPSQAYTCARY